MKMSLFFVLASVLFVRTSFAASDTRNIFCAPMPTLTFSKIKMRGALDLERVSSKDYWVHGTLKIEGFPQLETMEVKGHYFMADKQTFASLIVTNAESEYSDLLLRFTDQKDDYESFLQAKDGGILPLNCPIPK